MPDDRREWADLLQQLAPARRLEPCHLRLLDSAGRPRPVRISGYRLPDRPDRLYLAITHGMPTATPRPSIAAGRDQATGLLDKEAFGEAAHRRAAAGRAKGEDINLTLVNMDKLAAVRRHLNEADGRDLMTELAALLRAKSVDGDLAGRIDEEKFGVLHRAALNLAALSSEVEALVRDKDSGVRNFAVDTAAVQLDTEGMSDEESAQAVLYTLNKFSEKQAGTFSFTKLSDGCSQMLSETMVWMQRIKRTINRNSFSLAYQPIVALADNQVHHYEALLRLPGETVSPYKFVTLAEQLGSIADLDLAVLRRVTGLLENVGIERCKPLAINVSGRSLGTPGFVDALMEAVQRDERLCRMLLIEVTESSKITDLQSANEALRRVREVGVRICLDDFGVGAAAFEYLRALEVDFVKIDGSFVRDMPNSPFGRAFVKSIAALCNELEIATVAEFVENAAIAAALRDSGVTFAQGYYYGRPSEEMGWAETSAAPAAAAKVVPLAHAVAEPAALRKA
jgi:EAL domain-containing protein (putative c-di-GMP-specific phosphodiesterase class I)